MQFVNAIALCLILVGAWFFAENQRAGHSTIESFILAVGCVGFGVLLFAISRIGIKLDRIENRLKGSPDHESDLLD